MTVEPTETPPQANGSARWRPRRLAVALADAVLFAYAASWLLIGGLALASPQIGGAYAIASYAVAAIAFGVAVALRLKGDGATVDALARLVLLFGSGVTTNMGLPWDMLEAAGAASLYRAAAMHFGVAADALYLWLPQRPHWLKLAALLHFTAIYPKPLEFAWRVRRTLALPGVLWGAALAATAIWALVDLLLLAPWPARALLVATALIPLAGALALANVHVAYRGATADERGRIVTLLAAIVVGLTGEMLYHVWPAPVLGPPPGIVRVLHIAAPVGASLLVVYAVFVRGGLTPELVLRRTALYGLLSVGGLFLFSVLDEVLSSLLVVTLGLSEGVVSTVTVAALAVAFKPVHDRLSAWLARVVRAAPDAAPGAAVEATPAIDPPAKATSA